MTPLGIGRIVFLSIISILSAATAGLSAYRLAFIASLEHSIRGYDFLGLLFAAGIITVLTISVVRICDWSVRESWLSRTVVELSWLGVLWVLWMATAGYTTSLLALLDLGNCADYYGTGSTLCSEAEAVQALAWLTWLCIGALFTWELVFAIVAHQRGFPGIWLAQGWRHVVGSRPDLVGGAGGKYASVGAQDYGMDQMKAYDAPFVPQQQQSWGQPHPHQGGQRYDEGPYGPQGLQTKGQPMGMYNQPQWGQPYGGYGGQQDPYGAPKPSSQLENQLHIQVASNSGHSDFSSPPPQPPQPQPQQQPRQQTQQQYQQVPAGSSQAHTQLAQTYGQKTPGLSPPSTMRALPPPGRQSQRGQGMQGSPPGAGPAQNPYAPRGQQGYYGRAEV
ncbi:hypothetical protein DACRYDRAFT_108674 [Dacryopinax primogenitus]|uniref:MARVEL domain-containing protein n=1 Tax=Dacryopinax primogenitus (strain DJM 731) TaxID=1858805 RepID=M5FW64_DACPD|nr:uncharacterized protein DACRYDRAFT_108674 [Dacryopinax primogenitus]EJU00609.1 hypothetical protein DACRYDRAFT_108674 [Dacryopinax primogenitus]